jgi:sugar (pentulose or hexulose) kinase
LVQNNSSLGGANRHSPLILGIDVGTSGLRASLVAVPSAQAGTQAGLPVLLLSESVDLPRIGYLPSSRKRVQDPAVWRLALQQLIAKMRRHPGWHQIRHVVLDATSSTVLLCDDTGEPVTEAMMYDDQQATLQAQWIAHEVRALKVETAALGASSTLAKVLFLMQQVTKGGAHTSVDARTTEQKTVRICHQIDYLNQYLLGKSYATDSNNALKLGYDVIAGKWPDWVRSLVDDTAGQLGLNITLPNVVPAGQVLGTICPHLARLWGLTDAVQLHAGTTDSIAGFLASGAFRVGDAVTSLGSTLALKLISDKPIFSAEFGVYSHKLGPYWLVGGASNAGGAVILHYFDLEQLPELIHCLETQTTDLNTILEEPCYPLVQPGERFPIADPNLPPKLPEYTLSATDSVEQKAAYLHQLLQGLCHIEKLGYERLVDLGAPPVRRIFTVGGGTKNRAWQILRERQLSAKLCPPHALEASFGVTRLVSEFGNVSD